jgi:excisionase family DNA binding protein
MSRLLTPAEAAEYIGISRTSMYALIRERGIEHLAHPHGAFRIPEEACDAYLESITVKPRRATSFGRIGPKQAINHDALLERSRLEAIKGRTK